MRESVSVSSGPMWMNCDEVQQAVQSPHGTSDPRFPRREASIPFNQGEKSPAAKCFVLHDWGFGPFFLCFGIPIDRPIRTGPSVLTRKYRPPKSRLKPPIRPNVPRVPRPSGP